MKSLTKFLSVLTLLLSFPALAGDISFSWTPSTTRTDGSAYTNPKGFRIGCGSTSGTYTVAWDINIPTATSGTVGPLAPGTWFCAIKAVDLNNLESVWSNEVSKTLLPDIPPGPPTLVVQSTTVYYVVQQTDRFVLLPVGTVPPTTTCIPNQYVNGYYGVPRSAVTWAGTVRPQIVVAQC